MRSTLIGLLALLSLLCLQFGFLPPRVYAQNSSSTNAKPTVFRVKYVADNSVYVDAGRNAGIQEGMKLSVVEPPPDNATTDGVRFRGYPHVAELNVISVADSSAVCDVITVTGDLKIGEFAFLSPTSVEDRHLAESARDAENYPIVVAFTDGDPLDAEIHDTQNNLLNPESRIVGAMRGRFGFSYGGIQESGMNSKQLGLMIDMDMTHIAGTYWNFNGYWRGNLTNSNTSITGTGNATLTDLINRTYQLGFTYSSPYSPSVIGVGRVYLPWAPSLSTIDGGYYGRKINYLLTVGAFAGSTPDPTSWSYNPNQQIAGTFASVEYGDFDHLHFLSTGGLAVTSIGWRVARQFAFFENNLNWKRNISFYNSTQVDAARTSPLVNGGSNPTGVSQSYSSLHFQPIKLIGFGVNYNFFRQLPTFDPVLIGTGLLDKYLFTGLSGDVRLDLPQHIGLYASLGRSKTTTDTKNSLNQAYGISYANIWRTGLLLDAHYSKFDSDFGSGQYESLSLSRSITDNLHLQFMAGIQKFNSPFSTNTNAKFINSVVDYSFGRRYFVEGVFGWYQGTSLNYTQWSTVFGYRFGGLRH
ncbi:MAG TPA: hypothetical protein VGH37_15140 [Candidatus Acidoferrum sp.]|jgi:hypothetical protein